MIWKDIKGFEGLYQVSDEGKFRSLDCIRTMKNGVERQYYGKELSPTLASDDYLVVHLTDKKGVRKAYKVHRIIAETFIPNPLNLPIINHKNENKRDNRISNLEWCSIRYNLRYGTTQRRRAQKIGFRVRQFDANGKYLRTYVTMRAAARVLKLPMSGIYQSVTTGKPYKGFLFCKAT